MTKYENLINYHKEILFYGGGFIDTIFHNLLSSLSIHIITHNKDYLNDARLGNGCHYFGMLICGKAHFQYHHANAILQKDERSKTILSVYQPGFSPKKIKTGNRENAKATPRRAVKLIDNYPCLNEYKKYLFFAVSVKG